MNHNCQIFTPIHIVKEMLDLIGYKDNILKKYILDNSCGNGNFLIEIVKRYFHKALDLKKEYNEIKNDLETYIIGIEIEHKLVNECKKRLDKIAEGYGFFNIKWNIKCADGLKLNFDLRFDYIVGNPPYIAYAVLNKEQRKFVKETFESCSYGKFDYSYAFIEKCLGVLNDNGKMAFITPSNMFKTQFGKKIREIMLPYISKIIDYSYEKVFENVLTSPAITVFSKKVTDKLVYRIKSEKEQIINKCDMAEKWYFFNINLQGQRRFGDYFKVSNSVATLCNNVFVVDKSDIEKYNIEKGAIREAVSPKSKKLGRNEYIVFPYKYTNEGLLKYSEEDFKKKYPNAFEYLYNSKDLLLATNKDMQCKWFEFGRSQALAHLNQIKLLISTIATNSICVYELNKDQIPYSGLYIVPKRELGLEVAKKVLESKMTIKYFRVSGIVLSGTSVRISVKDVENLMF